MEQDSLIQRNLQLDQNISIIAIMIKYLLLLTDVKPLGKISENGMVRLRSVKENHLFSWNTYLTWKYKYPCP